MADDPENQPVTIEDVRRAAAEAIQAIEALPAVPAVAVAAPVEYRVTRQEDVEKFFEESKKRAADPAATSPPKRAAPAKQGELLPSDYKYTITLSGAELKTEALKDLLYLAKPRSATAPRQGVSVSIGKFNEGVFLLADDCGSLDEAPLKHWPDGGTTLCVHLTSPTVVRNLKVISEYLRDKTCTLGVSALLGTEESMRSQFVELADATGLLSFSLKDYADPTKRAFTIVDQAGETLEPDNAVLANRAVQRIVFQPCFVSFVTKDKNVTVFKTLTFLELGCQSHAPEPGAGGFVKRTVAVNWKRT